MKGPNVLFGEFSSLVTKKKKDGKWQHVTDEINRINGKEGRTAVDVLKKYQNLYLYKISDLSKKLQYEFWFSFCT